MLTAKDLLEQREQMQEDANCILDGEDFALEQINEMIVERMDILCQKLTGKSLSQNLDPHEAGMADAEAT